MDRGPIFLAIICKHYKIDISLEKLSKLTEIGKEGVNLLGKSDAAERIGYKTLPVQYTATELINNCKHLDDLHVNQVKQHRLQ